MNMQAEKIEVMKMIIDTDNSNIINSIKALFKKEKKTDFWKNLSQNEQEDILKGIAEVKNGDTIDYDSFISKHR